MVSKKVEVTTDDGGRSISITAKLPFLPEHVDFQSPFEILISERIPLDNIKDENIQALIDDSSNRIIEGGISFCRKVEGNRYLMQRLCKWPQMIDTLGNGPKSEYLLPLNSAPQQPQDPASTDAGIDAKQTEPLKPEPDQALSTPSPPPLASAGTVKTDEEIAQEIVRRVREQGGRATFVEIRTHMSSWCPDPDRYTAIVDRMLDDWQTYSLYEPQIGYFSIIESKKDGEFHTAEKPPEKPAGKVKDEQAVKAEALALEARKRREAKKAAPSHPPKSVPTYCKDCKQTFPSTQIVITPEAKAGLCPFCKSPNWGEPPTLSQAGDRPALNLNGRPLTVFTRDVDRPICPLCLDAGSSKILTREDVEYAVKMKQPIVTCQSHRKEWYSSRDTPKVRESMVKAYEATRAKYSGPEFRMEVA